MDLLDFLNHLLNFLAPALWLAVLVPLLARVMLKPRSATLSLRAQGAVNFVVAMVVLLLGLALFGRDGKMATYTAMVFGCGSCQWALLRGWRAS